MAISKERKNELVAQYVEWLKNSQAVVITEYSGLTMKQLDDLRTKTRDAGGEFHIVKNTLGRVAFQQAGLKIPEGFLEGSTAVAFAFQDAPAMAKTITEFARTSDFVKVKGGYLTGNPIQAEDVKALSELPPLPVMRARVLGVLLAPASQLVRTIAEPARQVATVLKAYADKDASPAAA
ncbi:MAG TPA: 50S ribosomal protein L10 [Anaerolineales bacterium]|nr:50S ribosomal protein L10 [Anaerolineales bacterium]